MINGPVPDVAAALTGFAHGRAALEAGVEVEPLAGGIANRSVRVRSAAGDWVVRLAGDTDGTFAINRIAERQVHAAAARLGFAPAIVYAAPEHGVLVTEYFDGHAMSAAELRAPDGLRAIGARLAALHATPPPRGVRRLDVHEVLAHYLELPGVPSGPVSREDLGSRLRWSLANYRQSAVALCHNDLHHGNVIAAERLCFVDWEYGGVGDPLFEIAAIIGYHDLDATERDLLLAAYGRPFAAERVTAMCLVFDCLHALWLDAARAWGTLEAPRREALLARLRIDPAEREA